MRGIFRFERVKGAINMKTPPSLLVLCCLSLCAGLQPHTLWTAPKIRSSCAVSTVQVDNDDDVSIDLNIFGAGDVPDLDTLNVSRLFDLFGGLSRVISPYLFYPPPPPSPSFVRSFLLNKRAGFPGTQRTSWGRFSWRRWSTTRPR